MIGEAKLTKVQQLLKRQVPKTEIARQVGIARRTVYDIAIGVERRRVPKPRASGTGRCPTCGTPAHLYQNKGRLGCFNCITFGPPGNRRGIDGRRI